MEITITPAAEKFMLRMVRMSGPENTGFRLSVTAGGCSGFDSRFTLEPAALADDTTVAQNGLILFLPAETCKLLDGGTIDCSETGGLVATNPHAGNCGCDSSGKGSGGHHQATINISAIQRKV